MERFQYTQMAKKQNVMYHLYFCGTYLWCKLYLELQIDASRYLKKWHITNLFLKTLEPFSLHILGFSKVGLWYQDVICKVKKVITVKGILPFQTFTVMGWSRWASWEHLIGRPKSVDTWTEEIHTYYSAVWMRDSQQMSLVCDSPSIPW